MGTVADVAALAGVSPSTVSRVLSGKASALVSAATQTRVRDAAQQLGYRPSAAARALATGRSNTVALCCCPVYDSGIAELIRAVHDAANTAGYHLLLVDHNQTDEIRELLVEQRVDAVVWMRYPVHDADTLLDCLGAPHQVVIAIGEIADSVPQKAFAAVWSDRQGMRVLLEHLAALGHRHVAYLGGRQQAGESKRDAFERGCTALSLHGDLIWADDETDRRATGAAMAEQVLRRRRRPTALVARNDDFALGAVEALQNAGLTVPRDMSVTGYHDGRDAVHCRPPLTSLRTPELQGVAQVLPAALAVLNGTAPAQTKPSCLHLDVQLTVRASTARPAEPKE